MKNILPVRFGIIQKVILVLAVFAMTVVWPLGAFPVSHVSSGQWDGQRMSGPSNEEGFVRQEFSPNFENLESISVYVVNDPEYIDTMQAVLRVYDYTGACLSENFFQVEEYELPGYINIPVELELSPGTLYFYTIGGVDGDLLVAYCGDEAKTAENGALFYKEVPSGGTSIVTEYEYERPMGLKRILLCDLGILAFAFALIIGINCLKNLLYSKIQEDKAERAWLKAERNVCHVVAGFTVLGVILAFWGIVIKQLFTSDALNVIVLFVSVVIIAALIIRIVYNCKSETEPIKEGEGTLTNKAIHLIRALLFAATIIMCCLYIDGFTNFHKGLETRKVLVFFGLFMISLGNWKQVINIPNAVWSVLAVFIGKYYISLHSDHIEHINTATNSAWVIWVIGLLVIQFVIRLIQGEWRRLKKLCIPSVALTILFFAGCVIFANTRTWPAMLAVAFTVWILFYTMSENKEKILEDMCNGLLLAFIGTVIFCLYRRPYQYYMLTRYAGVFFTATTTATYYVVPAAAALTKTLLARRENNKSKELMGWSLFGVIAAYMSFTASRTGIVSMAVMAIFALCMPLAGEKKGFVKRQLKQAAIMVSAVILAFIACFGATRMLPAMAGNPYYFPYESSSAYISSETPWQGGEEQAESYITVQRTLSMLFGRLFTAEGNESDAHALGEQGDEQGYNLGPLLASTDTVATMGGTSETTEQYANGRFDIYRAYLNQLNMTGHDTMSAMDAKGEALMHAHNSYLQVAFDFGIPVGIIFVVLCLVLFVKSVYYAYTRGLNSIYACLPLLLIVGFGVASIFEWIYHPCNPAGFAFLTMIAPLMLKNKADA